MGLQHLLLLGPQMRAKQYMQQRFLGECINTLCLTALAGYITPEVEVVGML